MTDDELLAGLAEAARRDEQVRERTVDRIQEIVARDRRRRRRLWTVVTTVGSLAAAFLVFVILRPLRGPGALPDYALWANGIQDVRGSDPQGPSSSPIPRVGPSSRLEISLRPAHDAGGPIALRSFLARDGDARPWDAPADIAPSGAVRIEGDGAHLFPGIPPGEVELILVVGRPGTLPSTPEAVKAAGADAGAPFRVLRRRVILEGAP